MKILGVVLPRVRKDWRKIIKRAWSVRLLTAGAIFSGAEVAMQVMVTYQVPPPVPPMIFAGLAGLTTCVAGLARIVSQRGFDDAD